MKLTLAQLSRHLQNSLLPIYWVSGDEVLLVSDAIHAIRATAHHQTYSTQSLAADQAAVVDQLQQLTGNLSLFSDKQLLELQIANSPPEKLTQWLKEYCQNPSSDTVIVVRSPKLSSAQTNSTWFRAIEQIGAHLPIWPIELAQLPLWLQQRAQKWQLTLPLDAAQYLASRTEGNLLAANQELEKLALSYTGKTISLNLLEQVLEDQARYDVFNLTSAVLKGETARVWRILQHLKNDSSEYTLILWALTKELRALITLHSKRHTTALPTLYRQLQIWDKRIPEVQLALARLSQSYCEKALCAAAAVDCAIKGLSERSGWEMLSEWVIDISRQRSGNNAQGKKI